MILEYLILNEKIEKNISEYKNNNSNIKIEEKKIKDSDFILVRFIVDIENDENASILSKINQEIIKNNDYITLINDSASYYNEKLYPLINKFERKLRKTLYLASKLSNSSDSEIIHNIEEMDFGNLFELLFTDDEFIKKVKTEINKKNWKFNKQEIIDEVNEADEKTLWDKLLGDLASTLQENYIKIKNYRNSTMHAHNITHETFKETESIFKTINDELDEAINKILSDKIKILDKDKDQDFNNTLKSAIDTDKTNVYSQPFKDIESFNEQMKKMTEVTNILSQTQSAAKEAKKMTEVTNFLNQTQSAAKEAKKMTEGTNILSQLQSANEDKEDTTDKG